MNVKPSENVVAMDRTASSEAKFVSELKTAVTILCAKMQEADARGITIAFNIDKAADGKFAVTKLDVTKRL
jgi:hypothetical protein